MAAAVNADVTTEEDSLILDLTKEEKKLILRQRPTTSLLLRRSRQHAQCQDPRRDQRLNLFLLSF